MENLVIMWLASIWWMKLGLKESKHPRPYKLWWLNDLMELKIYEQVIVPLSVGKYQDQVTPTIWQTLAI